LLFLPLLLHARFQGERVRETENSLQPRVIGHDISIINFGQSAPVPGKSARRQYSMA